MRSALLRLRRVGVAALLSNAACGDNAALSPAAAPPSTLAAVASVDASSHAAGPPAASQAIGPRVQGAHLELRVHDIDSPDPFASIASRIDDTVDLVSNGSERGGDNRFAVCRRRAGESLPMLLRRFQAWLAPVPIPEDRDFAFGPFFENVDNDAPAIVGLRTYLLKRPPVLTDTSVTAAVLSQTASPAEPGRRFFVLDLTLSPDGQARLDQFEAAGEGEILALVIDGNVASDFRIGAKPAPNLLRVRLPVQTASQLPAQLASGAVIRR